VQQSSNTTYRLWDWNRKPARPLHIDQACEVAIYEEIPGTEVRNYQKLEPRQWHRLVRNEFFDVRLACWYKRERIAFGMANPHGLVFSVLDFLLFIARLWTAYLLIRMITPSSRRDRATEAFEFSVRPFSLLTPPLRIALLVTVHLLIVLELHMLVTKQFAGFQML
jgi:hypothetical protein